MGRPLTTVSCVHGARWLSAKNIDLLLSRTGVGVWVSPACLSQTSNLLPLRRAERTHPIMRLASFRRWSTSVIFDFKTAMSTCKEFSVLYLRPYCPRRRRVFRVRRPPNAHILDSPIWDATTQNLLKGVLPLHSLFFPNTPIYCSRRAEAVLVPNLEYNVLAGRLRARYISGCANLGNLALGVCSLLFQCLSYC